MKMSEFAYTIIEGSVSITLFGPVNKERDARERAIAQHRHIQLNYQRAKVQERRIPTREEFD